MTPAARWPDRLRRCVIVLVAVGAAAAATESSRGSERPGAVAFSTDVAPVLLDACVSCHGPDTGRGGLRMHTLATLLAARVVEPGRGARSVLVRKMRGTDIEGQRMPLDAPPLDEAVVARIERWIDEGARIDLLGPTATLEAVVVAGRTASLSDEDLAEARRAAAEDAWRRALPDEEAVVDVRDRLTVVGNLSRERLAALADTAAEVEERVRVELVGRDGRLLKGGLVLFAFRNAYDYSAFWQQVVGAERPRGLTGHAGTVGEAVYGACLVPAGDPTDVDTRLLLVEQLCGAALVGRGAPDWFARGAGRALAARLHPKAAPVQSWKRDLPAAVRGAGSCADVLGGRVDPGLTAVVAGGFVGSLASTSAKLRPLLTALDGGAPFDAAFAKAFRSPPAPLYEAWAAAISRQRAPSR